MDTRRFYRGTERPRPSSKATRSLFPSNKNSPPAAQGKKLTTAVKRQPASSLEPRTKAPAKRLISKKAAAVTKVLKCNDERGGDKTRVVHLENLLAQRTAELAAEKRRVAPLLADKDAAIASLKADLEAMRAQNESLRQENNSLKETNHSECQREGAIVEEVRAGFGQLQAALEQRTQVFATPVRPIPRFASTPESSQAQMSPLALSCTTMDDSVQICRQHPDVSLRVVAPEEHARLHQQSYGQVGRYGCLLFRRIISEDNYKAWSKTTNWDGSRGKQELPQNVKNFVVDSLKKRFPGMEIQELKDCIDKINECLRTPRKSSKGLILL